MSLYFGGEEKCGGFRFLSNGFICIDFYSVNEPINHYLTEIVSYINNNRLTKVFVCSQTNKIIDISFLKECKGIEELQISAFCKDLEAVYQIKPNKLSLQIQDYSIKFEFLQENLIELDLYNVLGKRVKLSLDESILTCKKLKFLSVSEFGKSDLDLILQMSWINCLELAYCPQKSNLENFNQMVSLTELRLQKVSEEFFNAVTNISSLKKLVCTQVPFSSLNGVEKLANLEQLHINHCAKLTNISAIERCQNLELVKFESVKKIGDYTPLKALKALKDLTLFNCGEVESLNFINDIPSLENLLFTGTNIVDGDLTPCLRLKSAWSSFGKRHYNMKVENLPHG